MKAVSNSSVLIALSGIGGVSLLKQRFAERVPTWAAAPPLVATIGRAMV